MARRLGELPEAIRWRRDLLRIDAPTGVEEAYPTFQFEADGLRREVAFVVLLLKRRITDEESCDWLLRTNPRLGHRTPSEWLRTGAIEPVIEALPRPTRPMPGPAPDIDLAEVRSAWLRLNGVDVPGWHTPWEDAVTDDLVSASSGGR